MPSGTEQYVKNCNGYKTRYYESNTLRGLTLNPDYVPGFLDGACNDNAHGWLNAEITELVLII